MSKANEPAPGSPRESVVKRAHEVTDASEKSDVKPARMLPCPFCGAEVVMPHGWHLVPIVRHELSCYLADRRISPEDAIDDKRAWNQRAGHSENTG